MPLRKEIALGPGNIVLDWEPAPPRKGAQQPLPNFRPMCHVDKRSPISATAVLLFLVILDDGHVDMFPALSLPVPTTQEGHHYSLNTAE